MITSALTRAEVEATLSNAKAEILGLGVRRLALFGSVGRDVARAGSDIVAVAMPETPHSG